MCSQEDDLDANEFCGDSFEWRPTRVRLEMEINVVFGCLISAPAPMGNYYPLPPRHQVFLSGFIRQSHSIQIHSAWKVALGKMLDIIGVTELANAFCGNRQLESADDALRLPDSPTEPLFRIDCVFEARWCDWSGPPRDFCPRDGLHLSSADEGAKLGAVDQYHLSEERYAHGIGAAAHGEANCR